MAKKNTGLVAAAVLGAFALGLLLGKTIDAQAPDAPNGRLVLTPEARENVEAGQRERQPARRSFQNLRDEDAARPERETPDNFAYERLVIDTAQDAPRGCFQFNRDLDATGDVTYGDYVLIEPDTKPAISVSGRSLCLQGLSFDRDYQVTLREGLPAAGAKGTLARSERVTVAFGDKPAYVGFAGNGTILPRFEADGIGIETVNVEKLQVRVLRVSDRSLARKNMVRGENLTAEDYAYVWGENDGEDVGVEVYKDDLAIKIDRNALQTTVFSLGSALAELKPGAYFIQLEDVSEGVDQYRKAQAWRWVVFTDMALTTFSGADGVDVFVRSIASARPLAGVDLALIAENNDVLGTTKTNTDGRGSFAAALTRGEGPLTPRMIMAYGPQEDYAALDLRRASLDLSAHPVSGRDAPAKTDAYVYLDRGIYRPGETVHISGLVRDDAGNAIKGQGATAIVRRPNQTEAARLRVSDLIAGGFTFNFDLPASAPRGEWRIDVTLDSSEQRAGFVRFSVEDFVPQRLEVVVDADEDTPMSANEVREVSISSRYLYGAPASDLKVESEARLRIDPNPFPDYKDYRYGAIDPSFNQRYLRMPTTKTDASGAAKVPLSIDGSVRAIGIPMRADVVSGVVEPGGRIVRESARIPVRPDDHYLGLKLDNDNGFVGRNDSAQVSAILLDRLGAPIVGEVEWRLVEEDYWFDWYRENGRWRWRRSYKDVLVAEGRDALEGAAARVLDQKLPRGSYRLSAWRAGAKTKTDLRFYVGWRSHGAGADTPDEALLSLDAEKIAPGARATLRLTPPYAGEAIIAIATDRIHKVQRVKVDGQGRDITIDTDADWGAGFYVLASVVTPRDAAKRPEPRRAMAVQYVPFDMSARTLSVSLDTPEVLEPRQTLDLPVQIDGASKDAEIYLTLAAVDEGILRLTKFKSPNPVDHFYGKKRLGVDVRDDYGRIMHANLGAPARFGGDQIGGEGLTVVPTKSIALFSGMVEIDDKGKASVPIEVPDFNGELRLMSVAWTDKKLGQAAGPMTVRDAVPASLALPRFLAPGDSAAATLLIDNVAGNDGAYEVRVTSSGPVEANGVQSFALTQGEKATHQFSLRARGEGISEIKLDVTGPGGFAVSRTYQIQSRAPYYPITVTDRAALGSGERYSPSAQIFDLFVPGSATASVSFSRLRGVEIGPLLDALYRYPYGCSEQLTSTALPLLYLDQLGGEVGRNKERAVRPRVQAAINKLLDRQGSDGAFGLWRVSDRNTSPWLGAYITDFLWRAKQQGYAVPQEAMDRAFNALQNISRVDRWRSGGYNSRVPRGDWSNDTYDFMRYRSAAYAQYVLTRAGKGSLSELRYLHDTALNKTKNPLTRAHIGASLAMLGDRARANNAFNKMTDAYGWDNTGDYYQTPLRDAAGVLAVSLGHADEAQTEKLVDEMGKRMKEPRSMHTQEKAFVLMAAQALLKNAGPLALTIDNKEMKNLAAAPIFAISQDDAKVGKNFENSSAGQIFRTTTISGTPISAPPPVANGITLTKRLYSLSGGTVDLATLTQNDRFIISISGAASDKRLHPTIIADLLPPGLEIETVLDPSDAGGRRHTGPYAFLGTLSYPKLAEARDDRFVAAIDVREKPFKVAYVVRAVTPGAFTMPGAVIEDMYRPDVHARTSVGAITIKPAP